MESLLHDLKFGLKLLWKEKGFSITALLTLAICIAANASIFSVINSVLFNPLPFHESDRVVMVSTAILPPTSPEQVRLYPISLMPGKR